MKNELKVGSVDGIVAALLSVPNLRVEDGTVTVWTDTSEVDALRQECKDKREKLRGFSVWVLGPEDPKVWELF